jgi:ribosomal protein S2
MKKINLYKNKLIKLKLIQTKTYKKNYNNFIKIEDITSRLKKALHIIYHYHINNKRIVFIGTPLNIIYKFQKLLKTTKHILIPESIWVSGLLTNQKTCFKHLSKNPKFTENKTSKVLFQLKKKIDLIVVLNFMYNQEAINEAYLSYIPSISLNCDLKILNNISSYKIPGNFKFTKKKVRDILFYSILAATFKKAQRDFTLKKYV